MLVPETNTRVRCTGDDESAPKTRDSTRRRCTARSKTRQPTGLDSPPPRGWRPAAPRPARRSACKRGAVRVGAMTEYLLTYFLSLRADERSLFSPAGQTRNSRALESTCSQAAACHTPATACHTPATTCHTRLERQGPLRPTVCPSRLSRSCVRRRHSTRGPRVGG